MAKERLGEYSAKRSFSATPEPGPGPERSRGGHVIAVATEGDENIKRVAEDVLYVPDIPECLSPMLTVIPLQLMAYHAAVLRGHDVDKPRNLAKSVTVE